MSTGVFRYFPILFPFYLCANMMFSLTQRKSRCDPGIPRCEPCERSNAKCVYFDPTRNDTIPRTYILQLREKARQLEEQIANVENEIKHAADAELMVRGAGRIKFNQNDEPRYLGPSSGIAIARLVMELAKQNTDSKSIKAVVPEIKAQEIKDRFEQESLKPTSKIYPIISSIPQPNLPNRYVTDRLIDYFMVKGTPKSYFLSLSFVLILLYVYLYCIHIYCLNLTYSSSNAPHFT